MKKMLFTAAIGALALSLASCGGSDSDCTTEALNKKATELQDAMKVALQNPAKASANAQTWMQKAQDLAAKAQAAGSKPTAEVCKAYDDLIASVKQ